MSAPKGGARRLVGLALSSIALAAGCYSTAPHRAQFVTQATPRACSAAIDSFFAGSGFIQLPTPPHLSMLFTARVSGPYTSFLRTGSGVGVTVNEGGASSETCNVTLEALSPDVNCADVHAPLSCVGPSGGVSMDAVTGSNVSLPPGGNQSPRMTCPTVAPVMCELSYAPGADNDAAVDDLARRLHTALRRANPSTAD
jgi:hypothetical protein